MCLALLFIAASFGHADATTGTDLKNGWLYFAQSDYQRGQIYRMRPDGSERRQLTHVARWAMDPTLNTDGTLMAFVHNNQGVGELYLLDPDGSNLRSLAIRLPAEKGALIGFRYTRFTPDGTRLVFVLRYLQRFADTEGTWYIPHPQRGNIIYQVNRDGTHLSEIARENGHITGLAFSADGRQLLWAARNAKECHALRTLTLHPRHLQSTPLAGPAHLTLTATGPWLVKYLPDYYSRGGKLTDLATGASYPVNVRAGRFDALTEDEEVCISPDGRSYVSTRMGYYSIATEIHLTLMADPHTTRLIYNFQSGNGYIWAIAGLYWASEKVEKK